METIYSRGFTIVKRYLFDKDFKNRVTLYSSYAASYIYQKMRKQVTLM